MRSLSEVLPTLADTAARPLAEVEDHKYAAPLWPPDRPVEAEVPAAAGPGAPSTAAQPGSSPQAKSRAARRLFASFRNPFKPPEEPPRATLAEKLGIFGVL